MVLHVFLWMLLAAPLRVSTREYREFEWQKEWFENPHDPDAVKHYKRHEAQVTDEAKTQGRAFACGICQTIARTSEPMVRSKMSEKEMKTFFESTCSHMERKQSESRLNPEDTKVLCRRVVRESLSDIIDAISVGDGYQEVCQELGLCDKTFKGTMEEVIQYQKKAEEKEKDDAEDSEEDAEDLEEDAEDEEDAL